MAPTPEMCAASSPPGDRQPRAPVVISGMSGLYPRAQYIKDLEHILYNKINPITSEDLRWKYNHPEVAQYTGSVPDLNRFDAQFFKVHYRLAGAMDIMARKILEKSYEAIYDSGVSPEQLSGKKVGVYIGTCFSETEKACFYLANSRTGFGIAGCSKTMFANRISYWLNVKGPSLSIDDACCSSTAAVEQAYLAIARGECEAAVVGGANLCLHPQSSVHYGRIMTLSQDGKTKSFDQNAAGCTKSEVISVMFLQRSSDALRVYADLLHVKTKFMKLLDGETGPKYGFYRDPSDSAKFLNEFYEEAGVPPRAVGYVEAVGCAVPEADKSELEAFDEVFCKGREAPLLVGSVMSNIGYGEAASGISGITKVLLGFHRGELAGNLHCESPRSDVAALREGRIQVLQDHKPFRGPYAAVNSMSVTGVNGHVLLHATYKPKDLNRYKSSIAQLVTISGRQDSSVKRVIDNLKSRTIDPEELALLRNIHKTRIAGHLGRGYVILDTDQDQNTISLTEKSDYFDGATRPLWFVYSGMGSQWAGMGEQLMRIPVFAAAIERCRLALEPHGLDIVNIITSPDKHMFDNILHSFVGIAAVQIGLTDVLRELGIVPDNIIGHSVGELGCAYADGCLTAEEMILSAYSRGRVSLETDFIRGSMAAVGIGYQDISKMCPPEIEVACHNGPESSTISGPAEAMTRFVAELTAKGIFAKEVPCSNIAYHSRYIAEAGPGLLKYLKEVIKSPKLRTERWVSTSVPQADWDKSDAKLSSAQYHTNNLLSPVLFEETIKLIPSNAVLIEIAPHGLLQAILKRSLPESCVNIPLTRRGHVDNTRMVLEAVGKLYMEGFNPDVQALYPKIEFPVATGTPMLSHLVDWAHGEIWSLPLYQSAHRTVAAACKYTISVYDEEYTYLRGRVVRGKTVVPFSLALVAVWDTLAMTLKVPKKQLSVEFRDVVLFAEPVLREQRALRLSVALHRGSGRFEVMHENCKIASGYINSAVNFNEDIKEDSQRSTTGINNYYKAPELYQMLYEKGFDYRDEFCVIRGTNESMTEADLVWNENWVTFIDGLIQLHILRNPNESVSRVSHIRHIAINVDQHKKCTAGKQDPIETQAKTSDIDKCISCGGVSVEYMVMNKLPPVVDQHVDIKCLTFVPRFQSNCDTSKTLNIFLQIVAENSNKDTIRVVGLTSGKDETMIFKEIKNIAKDKTVGGVQIQYHSVAKNAVLDSCRYISDHVDVIIVQDLSNDDHMCQILHKILKINCFVINEEQIVEGFSRVRPSALYSVVAVNSNIRNNIRLELARWRPTSSSAVTSSAINIRSESDLTLLVNARKTLPPQNGLIIISSYPPVNGLKNLVKEWRQEKEKNAIYLVMVKDGSLNIKGLEELPNMDLAYNILDNGVWGGEYYVPIKKTPATDIDDVMLTSEQIGNLESLKWVQVPKQTATGVSVTVHYAGMNLHDVQTATLLSSTDQRKAGFGMDYSGISKRGERVMGLVPNGSARSEVIAVPELLWPVPQHWSLKEAATVPLAYTYAFYMWLKGSREYLGQYKSSILVHGGTGAVGQAMISIALAHGLKVFATVSSVQKKKFLMRLFPQLKEEHIGNSRDGSFADMVLQHTDGEGVTVVVCCVRGDLKHKSFKCAESTGLTFDTLHIKNEDSFTFGMYNLTKDRSYVSLDISSLFSTPNLLKKIQYEIAQGISSGYVRPLSSIEYGAGEAARALRLLAASRHRGRVLLRLADTRPQTTARIACSPDHNHLIVSDGEPLGLQLVERLISRGARKIHLNILQKSSVLYYKLRSWKSQGITVTVSSRNLTDESSIINFLKTISNSGFLAGVFIVVQNIAEKALVKTFDSATRKSCPYMKYFLVVGNNISHETFLNRAKDGLPATCLDIFHLEKYQDAVWFNHGVSAVERALCSPHPILRALPKKTPSTPLMQQIAAVANIKVSNEISHRVTLESIGVDSVKSQLVSKLLSNVHNVYIDTDEIPTLTIDRINDIEESLMEINLKDLDGLKTFYSYAEPDELLATTESVMLPTLTNSATMRDDEFDMNETYLCVVPGLDGLYARFHTLCERLKLPALVLQPGLDRPREDPDRLAHRYSKMLLRKTGLNKGFVLLGYEFGVIIALKLAAILEENGLHGTVFCVGNGPKETVSLIKEQLQYYTTDDDLQVALIRNIYSLLGDGETDSLEKALVECSSWEQRVGASVRLLLGRVPHSGQYARNLMEAAYIRIKMARDFTPSPERLQSQIVLIRAGNVSSSSSLQEYSVKPIIVHDVPTPFSQITNDLRCSSIINSHLPVEVLEAFNSRNLCDTYLLNADTFMTTAFEE